MIVELAQEEVQCGLDEFVAIGTETAIALRVQRVQPNIAAIFPPVNKLAVRCHAITRTQVLQRLSLSCSL